MRKISVILTLIAAVFNIGCNKNTLENNYLVLASEDVMADEAWQQVAHCIATKHNAEVVTFAEMPREALTALRDINPRYVAIVDMPENIGRDYVIDLHIKSP